MGFFVVVVFYLKNIYGILTVHCRTWVRQCGNKENSQNITSTFKDRSKEELEFSSENGGIQAGPSCMQTSWK